MSTGATDQFGKRFAKQGKPPDPTVASGGLDSTVKVWDARSGICLHTFRGHQDKVRRLQFVRLPEGLHLVSASSDQTVKFWPLASLEAAAGTPNR
jgi:WD40 repeat protein